MTMAGHGEKEEAYDRLYAAVKYAHEQRGDDKCWMDFDKVFEAAGLPIPDKGVGDKFAMLKNCVRYVEGCQEGNWKSYAEIEEELSIMEEIVRDFNDTTRQQFYRQLVVRRAKRRDKK